MKKNFRRNFIAHYRRARDFSQDELGELIGTSQAQVQRLETGERKLTIEWAEKIAMVLLCTITQLYYGPAEQAETKENTLLEKFRSLPPTDKETVLNMANYLADHKAAPNKTPPRKS